MPSSIYKPIKLLGMGTFYKDEIEKILTRRKLLLQIYRVKGEVKLTCKQKENKFLLILIEAQTGQGKSLY